MTVKVNRPSSRKRANAPAVGSHLPTRNDRMAATTVNHTNTRDTTYVAAIGSGSPPWKKTWSAPTQDTASDPPIHTGLVTQYRRLLTAPTRCPNASRVHRYGPPSCGNA